MPGARCQMCKKIFYVKPSAIARGWGKYCSKLCQNQSQKTGKIIQCFICGKDVYKIPKDLKHSKSKKYFCGKSCQAVWRNSTVYIGKKHPNWKHGEHAYRRLLLKSKELPLCKLCKTKDLRILAVHHIDRNRKNNTVDNLSWLCHNCHVLVHHHDEERRKFMEALV